MKYPILRLCRLKIAINIRLIPDNAFGCCVNHLPSTPKDRIKEIVMEFAKNALELSASAIMELAQFNEA